MPEYKLDDPRYNSAEDEMIANERCDSFFLKNNIARVDENKIGGKDITILEEYWD